MLHSFPVIASEAKQSSATKEAWIAWSLTLLAMTTPIHSDNNN